MKKEQLIELLKHGKIKEFNQFRKDNPKVKIDLRWANLRGANLRGANFRGADLRGADFSGAYFCGYIDFRSANLRGANFIAAGLFGAKYLTCEQLSKVKTLKGAKGIPEEILKELKEKKPNLFN